MNRPRLLLPLPLLAAGPAAAGPDDDVDQQSWKANRRVLSAAATKTVQYTY